MGGGEQLECIDHEGALGCKSQVGKNKFTRHDVKCDREAPIAHKRFK